ncbi:type I-D CRISPR-associated helicase Cas3' [Halorubrum sp. SD690R]|uniref:type I-D CRISPR-associated helicase Cas3' n=1 Tax=Halorubrum sp. SD690R TaxID=2518117 RepID=UPI0010F76108|nr:type I-D CRISPR-associated helicase Cas3' [Halorubrum sp. SD690R]TKX43650.1 type I-D CRISPR-associated helicase Cas3' [Halorubrum sp. SD690R]
MTEFEVAGASLATEPPEPALEDRGFGYARSFQNRVIEWIHDGSDPVSVVRAPTGAGKTATFYELIDSREMTLLVYPTNALLRQQRERFENDDIDVAVLNANTLDGHGHERTEQLLSFVNKYAADYDAVLTNPDILQAAIQDMYVGSDPMRFFNEFDAIVYDEFHFYEALSASGLLLQTKIIAERQPDPKILLASATPNEEFVQFLRNRIGLTIRDIDADYDSDGDQFRHRMVVSRHEDRKMIDCRDEIAAELQEKIDAIDGYDEPQIVLVFNSAKDSNDFHDFLYREYPEVFEHAAKDNGFDTNDETVDLDEILNTTSKGEVGLDYDVTTLYMEKPFTASAFLQRFGRAGRQSEATVDIYGLGQGPWGDDVGFPTFAEQIYAGLESTQMNQERLADLVGFRAAYALVEREEDSGWFNQELRADFETNIHKFDQWYGFIRKVIEEHGEIKDGFEPGKYQQRSPEAKLLEFTRACFKTFCGLRGQSLPVSIKYPRGDQLGVTTYDLSTTLRNYDIVDVEDDDVLVLGPSDDDILSTVTARLPAYETEPTKYDQSTAEIEELLQTKIHRRIDETESNDEFEVSTELLHRFFRIIRIVNAIIPSRITTSKYDIEVDVDVSGPPEIDVHPRRI